MKQWRINLILGLLFFLGAAIIGKLFFLQIIHRDFYAALAQGQQKFFTSTQGDRGKIFIQNCDFPLATNKNWPLVFASPREVEEKIETARTLSSILNLNEDLILEKLQKDNLYEEIKKKISEEEVEELKKLNLTGVYLGEEKHRDYFFGDFASHLLGFVNKDGFGQYGIEEYWQDSLQGKEEFIEAERGPWGYLFFSGEEDDSQGSSLSLTIDYNIQYLAEKLLKEAENDLNIEGGEIIVMDPHSGRILALAVNPSFNPNEYAKENLGIFENGAIQKIFEPGSVFKPITMAAALDQGKITPETTYFDQGCLAISGYDVCNYEERIYPGELTMTNVLEKSINTGAVFAERQVGNKAFLEYIKRFGIFEETGIDLPGEISSQNTELKKGYEVNFATASFGQGIEMTPIQLALAFSAIANGGKLVRPYIVEKIETSEGSIIKIEPKITAKGIISSNTASKLTAMLVSVVEAAYTRAARIPGYYVAGKTGTAQISFAALNIDKKGYSDKTWQSFVGFAPAFDPKFLILIKLNNPATKTAEYSALPIFKKMAKYIIDYWQIPPDYE